MALARGSPGVLNRPGGGDVGGSPSGLREKRMAQTFFSGRRRPGSSAASAHPEKSAGWRCGLAEMPAHALTARRHLRCRMRWRKEKVWSLPRKPNPPWSGPTSDVSDLAEFARSAWLLTQAARHPGAAVMRECIMAGASRSPLRRRRSGFCEQLMRECVMPRRVGEGTWWPRLYIRRQVTSYSASFIAAVPTQYNAPPEISASTALVAPSHTISSLAAAALAARNTPSAAM